MLANRPIDAIAIEPLDRPYDVEIVSEVVDGEVVFVARHPDLPGCMSHGDSPAAD